MSIPGAASPLFLSAAAAGDAAGYQIDRSLRFNQGDSPSLSKSFGSAGNRKKWTWSGWFKIGSESQPGRFFGAGGDATSRTNIFYYPRTNSLGIGFFSHLGGSIVGQAGTTAVLADHSAWYHLVFAFDAANSTTADRLKIYINGVEQSISYSVNVSNIDHHVNNNTAHYVGRGADGYSFDGYLAEVHFVDGQALAPTDFGQTNSDNNWDPKAYSGSYGTNGFYLKFADNSSTAALGTDSSGNNNTWTVNNLSNGAIGLPAGYSASGFTGNLSNIETDNSLYIDADSSHIDFDLGASYAVGTVTFKFKSYNDTSSANYRIELYSDSGYSNLLANSATSNASNTILTITHDFGSTSARYLRLSYQGGGRTARVYYLSTTGATDVGRTADTDSLIDTPTNYTAGSGNNGGNYATWNPLNTASNLGLANGNLDTTSFSGSSDAFSYATVGVSSGKWYYEATPTTIISAAYYLVGWGRGNKLTSNGSDEYMYFSAGALRGASSASYGASWTANDVIGVALDLDAGTLVFYKNGVSQGTAFTGITGTVFPKFGYWHGLGNFNFGQRPFAYTPPTGHVSLCTQNLADPTIADGSTAFEAVKIDNASTTGSITGLSFAPDFAWFKSRGDSGNHFLLDIIRDDGVLRANLTNAEVTGTDYIDWNSDGVGYKNGLVDSGSSNIVWLWDGGTSTVSNTDGSITSNVRANASAGFSIVKANFSSLGNETLGHGLNAAPVLYFIRNIDSTSNWYAYTTAVDGTLDFRYLNTAEAFGPSARSLPTSSVIQYQSIATGDHIAYCFAPVEGYSAFGSYAGNGSSDGPFVFTGFRPKFLIVKVYDQSDHWVLWDSVRGNTNVNNLPLYPNLSASESASTSRQVDLLSNGFKLRGTDNSINGSNNYLYIAFADHPFKTARAR